IRLLPHARVAEQHVHLTKAPFALVTLHRPSNVDDPAVLSSLMEALASISRQIAVVFPVHPRTRLRLEDTAGVSRMHLLGPLGYLEFLALEQQATVVITDSGGVQEETTYLGVPCVTVRENTERPVTLSSGTNTIAGTHTQRIRNAIKAQTKTGPRAQAPEKWDGRAGTRIIEAILLDLKRSRSTMRCSFEDTSRSADSVAIPG